MTRLHDFYTVRGWEYLSCSVNGNPKKRLILEHNNGLLYEATTATDAMCGYLHYEIGRVYKFTYHYTRTRGKMIIDWCEEV